MSSYIYNSYYLYRKYEKRGDQPYLPVFPASFSIDADGTMEKVMKLYDDPACSLHRWVDVPGSYECDTCDTGFRYRWVSQNPAVYTYIGDYKYEVLIEEISDDFGETWTATTSTKVSDMSIGVAEKKIKLTMHNGDVFASSCGSDDDGVWYSYPVTNFEKYYALNGGQHSTNLFEYSSEIPVINTEYVTGRTGEYQDRYEQNLPVFGVEKIEFGDCVYEIGDRYDVKLGYEDHHENEDTSESGQRMTNSKYFNYRFGFGGADIFSSIEEVVFPETLKFIGCGVFKGNNIKSLVFPSSVETIGCIASGSSMSWPYNAHGGPFENNTKLETIEFNEGLKIIGPRSFMGCTRLQRIVLPSTLEKIGDLSFYGCRRLSQIIMQSSTPPEKIYEDVNWSGACNTELLTVYVPCGSEQAYTDSGLFTGYATQIVGYGDNCGIIPAHEGDLLYTYEIDGETYSYYKPGGTPDIYMFSDIFDSADTVTLYTNVGTFGYCTYLIEPIINEYIINSTISESFYYEPYLHRGCDGTDSVFDVGYTKKITVTGNAILNNAFRGYQELEEVHIEGNPRIQGNTFSLCPALRDIYISYTGGVVSIDDACFKSEVHLYQEVFTGYPNTTVHVPCNLVLNYKFHKLWGNFNIVPNETGCTIPEPEYTVEVLNNGWDNIGPDGKYYLTGSTSTDGAIVEFKVKSNACPFYLQTHIGSLYGDNNYIKIYVDNILYTTTAVSGGTRRFGGWWYIDNIYDGNEHIVKFESKNTNSIHVLSNVYRITIKPEHG